MAVACAFTTSDNMARAGSITLRSQTPGTAAWTTHLQATCGLSTPFSFSTDAMLVKLSPLWGAIPVSQPVAALAGPLACVGVPLSGLDGFLCHPAATDAGMHAGVLAGADDGLLRVPGATLLRAVVSSFTYERLGYPCTHQARFDTMSWTAGALDALQALRPGHARTGRTWAAVNAAVGNGDAGMSRLTTHRLLPETGGGRVALAGLHTLVSRLREAPTAAGTLLASHRARSACRPIFHTPEVSKN